MCMNLFWCQFENMDVDECPTYGKPYCQEGIDGFQCECLLQKRSGEKTEEKELNK